MSKVLVLKAQGVMGCDHFWRFSGHLWLITDCIIWMFPSDSIEVNALYVALSKGGSPKSLPKKRPESGHNARGTIRATKSVRSNSDIDDCPFVPWANKARRRRQASSDSWQISTFMLQWFLSVGLIFRCIKNAWWGGGRLPSLKERRNQALL